MPSAQYGVSLTIGGVSIQKSVVRTNEALVATESTIPAAKALSSWVKTDADTAAGNLEGGHGWSTGTFDVYWEGGARFDVDVTIDTNACALDGGTGDDFPTSANATVVLAQQTAINFALDGDNADIIGLCLDDTDGSASYAGRALFEDAGGDDIADISLSANQPFVYDIAGNASNPFTGDPIASIKVSHASTTATPKFKAVALQDSTP